MLKKLLIVLVFICAICTVCIEGFTAPKYERIYWEAIAPFERIGGYGGYYIYNNDVYNFSCAIPSLGCVGRWPIVDEPPKIYMSMLGIRVEYPDDISLTSTMYRDAERSLKDMYNEALVRNSHIFFKSYKNNEYIIRFKQSKDLTGYYHISSVNNIYSQFMLIYPTKEESKFNVICEYLSARFKPATALPITKGENVEYLTNSMGCIYPHISYVQ